jgi:pimeloyl-ACP methyl ester carboxylesterase
MPAGRGWYAACGKPRMRLAVHRIGAPSNRTAVLIHGVTASHRTWWRVAPVLAEAGWHVLTIDLRCHGASPCAGPIRGSDLADDVAETLTAELGDDPVDVVWGHSLGARTAMQLLIAQPSRAGRVILEDPPGRVSRDREAAISNWRRESALAHADPEAFVRHQLADNPAWDERDARENVESLRDVRLDWIVEAFASGYREGAPDLVPRLKVPVLLVLADESRSVLVARDRAETIAALPPGSRAVELPGGHTLHRDCPDEYLRATLDWLRRPVVAE